MAGGAPTARVVVVGAGITGLTTAFTLLTRHPGLSVRVLEASDRVGGKILTTPFAGRPVDCGADAFLARVPEAVELCEELGLGPVLTSPAQRTALVYADGELRHLPAGLVLGVPTDFDALAASGIVSPAGVARARLDVETTTWLPGEPSVPGDADHDLDPGPDPDSTGDESVGALVRRRLGDEVFERLVAPLLSGVNAGDADHLSLAAGAAQLAAAARSDPSLVVGLRRQAAAARRAGADPDAPVFRGIPVGTQVLTDLLAARIVAAGGEIHRACTVTGIDRASTGWTVRTPRGPLDADAVVLTAPAPAASALLEPHAPTAAAGLSSIEYASVAMVTLAVPLAQLAHPLDASGFLVAHDAPLPALTACSWASAKWTHLHDPDLALLRVSAGRHGRTEALDLDDDELVRVLTSDLHTTMGMTGHPTQARVTRWVDALPQFRPGHLGRVASWRSELAEHAPGLVLAGAALDGLGVPACIRQGRAAADHCAGSVTSSGGPPSPTPAPGSPPR
jgi:oxygen-dependent protoporphyrinogen oxidase